MPTVSSGGVEIDYEVQNADSPRLPVFFITGLPGVRAAWANQMDAFTRRGPVVLHDHRGTGKSAKPLGVYSIETMASDVTAIMDAIGAEKAHLVGSSTGGAIAQLLCIERPERVQSATLAGTWPRSDHYFRRQFTLRKRILLEIGVEAYTRHAACTVYAPKYVNDNQEMLEKWVQLGTENSPSAEVVAERIDAIIAHDQMERLGKIQAPTLILVARDDSVTPPYYAEQLRGAIAGAELEVFPEGGHLFFQPHAAAFNAAVLKFIGRCEP
ncbi:MAG: alpha/beta hydrolase [bacterium]